MRKPFNFRLSEAGHLWLRERAKPFEMTTSDVLRACIAVGTSHPKLLDAELAKMKEAP